ncbi:MAG: hypothetical protein K2L05_00805 [Muribaculaceae bacterium]|nr:hypothetical protein [Muribaculaceae bacterium]
MKAIQLFMLAVLSAATAAATERTDTVVFVKNPTVVIVEDNGKSVVIQGCEGDPCYKFEYHSRPADAGEDDAADAEATNIERLLSLGSHIGSQSGPGPLKVRFHGSQMGKRGVVRTSKRFSFDVGCDIYAGAVIPLNGDAGMGNTGWQLGMVNVAKAQWRLSGSGTRLSLGLGWQYSYLTIGGGLMGSRNNLGAYVLEPIPDEYYNVKTSLRNFAVQIPMLLNQPLSGRFAIEAGAVAMLNTYTTGNRSWSEGLTKSKMPLKGLHQRILTVDVLARIGWRSRFALYVRYSPVDLFSPQYGPQFNPIAVGASIGF